MSEEIYLSNNGNGPGIARIISVSTSSGTVVMERKPSAQSKRKWVRFTLSEKFFQSKSCGWRKANPAAQHNMQPTSGTHAPAPDEDTQRATRG